MTGQILRFKSQEFMQKQAKAAVFRRAVLEMRESGLTLCELGKIHGLTKQRISQIVHKAMEERDAETVVSGAASGPALR